MLLTATITPPGTCACASMPVHIRAEGGMSPKLAAYAAA
jgi:hypothetical protein